MDAETERLVNERLKKVTQFWTPEDFELQAEAMKGISSLPIWEAVYQARKWAFLEARASTVKFETEEERKAWFDGEIDAMDNLIKRQREYKNKD